MMMLCVAAREGESDCVTPRRRLVHHHIQFRRHTRPLHQCALTALIHACVLEPKGCAEMHRTQRLCRDDILISESEIRSLGLNWVKQ